LENASLILDKLSAVLFDITGINKGKKFWKLILGHHIISLCGIVEDIYVRLDSLPSDLSEYALGVDEGLKMTANTSGAFVNLHNEEFRTCLMQYCIESYFDNRIFVHYQSFSPVDLSKQESYLSLFGRRIGSIIAILKDFSHNLKVYLFYNKSCRSYMADRYNNKILFSSGYLFYGNPRRGNFEDEEYCNINKTDNRKRYKILQSLPKKYGELLSIILPSSIIECFAEVYCKASSYRNIPRNINKIYTHGQIFTSSLLNRIYIACILEKGGVLYSIQHGGYMGMYESHPAVALEGGMVADEYISSGASEWGVSWISKYVNPPKSLPSPYFTLLQNKSLNRYRNKKNKYSVVLLVLSENRMPKWLYNPVFPDMAFDYFGRERVLLSYFNKINAVLVKTYKIDHGWGQYNWIKTSFANIECTCEGKFIDYAFQSDIVIVDYNSTGFSELLVMGIPFMATWNRNWFKGVPLYEECVDELINAGIFFENPYSLLKKYNSIKDNVDLWWDDSKRKTVKNVSNKIALVSSSVDDCIALWDREFQ